MKDVFPPMMGMSYEILMRKAYSCGRNLKKGADADIYRKLERAAKVYYHDKEANKNGEQKWSTQSIKQLEGDYISAFDEITHNIYKATNRMLFQKKSDLNDEQKEKLKAYNSSLNIHDMETLIDTINGINKIMMTLNLQPD